ncbi:serine/threonine-protein kinase [Rhizohabitans arisaemae]|uniref:serine/threonine-protein kinase n=1 Tax=Rhizohabitans arisaemae TaxID=2720610 RepID=UPI0024B11C87|nr:serine/threonine-protein kinase [Rhizohabitans arisaemae]
MIGARILADRYRLLNPLGSGGQGAVWLATDETLDREVAVKEIHLPPHLDAEARAETTARAMREAQACAQLNHPNIIAVHDVVSEDDRPWIVMELLSGQSLEQMVRERGPLPPRQIARIGAKLLSALWTAHNAKVLHRDVKPANVFLTRQGRVVLTDFGIATIEGYETLTATGMLIGSPGYIAPERLEGERGGPEADLWSLGATLYFGVEGVAPYPGDNAAEVLSAALTRPPRQPELAGPLGPVLMRMLARQPGTRIPGIVAERLFADIVRDRTSFPVAPRRAPAVSGPEPVRAPVPPDEPTAERTSEPEPRPDRLSRLAGLNPIKVASAGVAGILVAVVAMLAIREFAPGYRPAVKTAVSQPASSPLSERPGKFGVPVDLCKLVDPQRIRQVFPELTKPGKPDNSGGCSWTVSGVGLNVVPYGTKEQWGLSPQEAREIFINANTRTSISTGEVLWAWPEIGLKGKPVGYSITHPLDGIGEEAFTYDLIDGRGGGGLEMSSVVLRVSNLVIEVGYTDLQPDTDDPAIRQGALNAAKLFAESLTKHTG